jgi:hypothetical protein
MWSGVTYWANYKQEEAVGAEAGIRVLEAVVRKYMLSKQKQKTVRNALG